MKKLPAAFHARTLQGLASLAMASAIVGCGGDGSGGGSSAQRVPPEPPPGVRIESVTVRESDGGTVEALFRVSLSHSPSNTVTVSWRTVDDTAVAGEDYISGRGTLVFEPDRIDDVIDIEVMGDSVDEDDEDFAIVLSDAAGMVIEEGRATGRIEDDDAAAIADSSSDGGGKGKKKRKEKDDDDGDGDDDDEDKDQDEDDDSDDDREVESSD